MVKYEKYQNDSIPIEPHSHIPERLLSIESRLTFDLGPNWS